MSKQKQNVNYMDEENSADKQKQPIINCHTHIFTGDHVPPWLAKTFLIWPLYYLFSLSGIVKPLENPGRFLKRS